MLIDRLKQLCYYDKKFLIGKYNLNINKEFFRGKVLNYIYFNSLEEMPVLTLPYRNSNN